MLNSVAVEVKSGINIPNIYEDGWTNLHIAAIDNKIEEVEQFIEKWARFIDQQDIYGSTALHFAARWGHTKILNVLLRNGANINIINNIGWTPLHCACWEGQIDCVRQLLTLENTTIDSQSQNGWTALHFAARWGYNEIAQMLLEKNANHKNKDSEGLTAGHQAAIMGRVGILSLLNDKKLLNLFDKTNEGKTIIDYALTNKNTFNFCVNMSNNNYGLSFIQYVAIQENNKLFNKLLIYHSKKANAYKGIFPKNDFITIGRQQDLEEINQILIKNGQIIVRGISGMGKTALIIHYAWFHQNYYENNLYYVDCQNDEIFKEHITKIAKHLKIPTKKYDTKRDFKSIIKDTFNKMKTQVGLMVFDNVINLHDLNQFFDFNCEVHIIISGREVTSNEMHCRNLQPIPEEYAMDIYEVLFQDELIKESERHYVEGIICFLESVPLALHISKMQILRNYFSKPNYKLSDYFEKISQIYDVTLSLDHDYTQIIYKLIIIDMEPNFRNFIILFTFLNPSYITVKCSLYLAHLAYNKLNLPDMLAKFVDANTLQKFIYDSNNFKYLHTLIKHTLVNINDNRVEINHYAKELAKFYFVGQPSLMEKNFEKVVFLILTGCYQKHHKSILKHAKNYINVFTSLDPAIVIENLTAHGCITNLEVIFSTMADINAITKCVKQHKLLHAAVKSGCIKTVEFVYQYDNNITRMNENGHTMVWVAIEKNYTDILNFLISKGASLEYADKLNKTPLHRAAFLGHIDAVKLILLKGGNPNVRNKFQRTPLHYAAMEGHEEVIQELLNHNEININARDHYRRSPIFETVRCFQLNSLKLFIDRGARVQTKDNLDLSPIRLAKLQKNSEQILQVFKELGYRDEYNNEIYCRFCKIM